MPAIVDGTGNKITVQAPKPASNVLSYWGASTSIPLPTPAKSATPAKTPSVPKTPTVPASPSTPAAPPSANPAPSSYTGQGLLTQLPNWAPPTAGDTGDLRNVVGSGFGTGAVRFGGTGYAQGDIAAMKSALNLVGAGLTVDLNVDDAFVKALKKYGSKVQGMTVYTDPNTGNTRWDYSAQGLTSANANQPNPFADWNKGAGVMVGESANWAQPSQAMSATTNYRSQAEAQVNPMLNQRLSQLEDSRIKSRNATEADYIRRGMGKSSALQEVLADIDQEYAASAASLKENADAQIISLTGDLERQAQEMSIQQQQLAQQTRANDLQYNMDLWQFGQAKAAANKKNNSPSGANIATGTLGKLSDAAVVSYITQLNNKFKTNQEKLSYLSMNKASIDKQWGTGATDKILDTLVKAG